MAVEYLPKDQLRNHTNIVWKAYLHSSFQIHLNTSLAGWKSLRSFD
jgi:hypothetical protein